MKFIYTVLFAFILIACGGTPEKKEVLQRQSNPSEKDNEGGKTSLKLTKNNTITDYHSKQYTPKTPSFVSKDTLFIKREISKDYHHTIYIDKTANCEFKKGLRKLTITKPLKQRIKSHLATDTDQEKLTDFKLPQFWLPLEQYKGDYYLYNPCDGIFEFRYLLTKDAVAHLFYDGPSISTIKKSERINSQHYHFEFHESNEWEKLDIYFIDTKKKIAVFKFYEDHQTWYHLFTASTSMDSFDVIVNDCKTQKEMEFDFEKVDFTTLIGKIQ